MYKFFMNIIWWAFINLNLEEQIGRFLIQYLENLEAKLVKMFFSMFIYTGSFKWKLSVNL